MTNFSDATIIVVDDEEVFRGLVVDFVSEKIPTVYQAPNGVAALEVFAKHQIDIAILDINMPKMSGIDLLHRITKQYPHTLCIMLTGGADRKQIIEAIKGGAYDFLEKPFQAEIFEHHLDRAINVNRRNKLLFAAAKEFLFTHNNMDLEKFERLTIEEQCNALEAGLSIMKLKAIKKKKNE